MQVNSASKSPILQLTPEQMDSPKILGYHGCSFGVISDLMETGGFVNKSGQAGFFLVPNPRFGHWLPTDTEYLAEVKDYDPIDVAREYADMPSLSEINDGNNFPTQSVIIAVKGLAVMRGFDWQSGTLPGRYEHVPELVLRSAPSIRELVGFIFSDKLAN